MKEIKSAIEIALEKTKGIEGDRKLLESEEYIKKGKKIISAFLEDPKATLDGCFKDMEKDKIALVKKGMLDALCANLHLPQDETTLETVKHCETGFLKIIDNTKKVKLLFEQLDAFFREYLDGKVRIKEHIDMQYAPRLKQKQEALSKQLGAPVHLNSESDPEYMQVLKQGYAQFDERYRTVIDNVREELTAMFGR
ncbi:MAG: hypothetical protein JW881_21955 [Spirochaetales bacterium]|nr:hypothetical protein [Spirochaetales bacterium]